MVLLCEIFIESLKRRCCLGVRQKIVKRWWCLLDSLRVVCKTALFSENLADFGYGTTAEVRKFADSYNKSVCVGADI